MIESLPPFMAGVDDSVETRDMWKDTVLLSSGKIKYSNKAEIGIRYEWDALQRYAASVSTI